LNDAPGSLPNCCVGSHDVSKCSAGGRWIWWCAVVVVVATVAEDPCDDSETSCLGGDGCDSRRGWEGGSAALSGGSGGLDNRVPGAMIADVGVAAAGTSGGEGRAMGRTSCRGAGAAVITASSVESTPAFDVAAANGDAIDAAASTWRH